MMKRAIVIVLDSLGIGALEDAKDYGDENANTLGNIVKNHDIHIPNLVKLGLGHIEGVDYLEKTEKPLGAFGRASELSKGKDTTAGHWEMMGLPVKVPFNTFPEGFPKAFIAEFEKRIGRKTMGNYPASGTEIIKDLGEEHIATGDIIVYTSADSVFQIAAHEGVVALEELYKICEIAREMLVDDLQVARVIARPFIGENGNYTRTENRRDFSISPFENTALDHIKNSGKVVYAVGKIEDIFNKQGITKAVHTKDNMDGVDKTLEAMEQSFNGLLFTNLVDFDAQFGHRRNCLGYKGAMEEFDARLPEILGLLKEEDILILTADHGNDPAHHGTDHTREYVPILVVGKHVSENIDLKTRESFADIGASICDYLAVTPTKYGKSFIKEILK